MTGPLSRLAEDQPGEPFTGAVAGYIPSVPGGRPEPAVVPLAYASLPNPRIKPRIAVGTKIYNQFLPVSLADDLIVWLASGDQAREFIRAFAHAAEVLDNAQHDAVPFGSETTPGGSL